MEGKDGILKGKVACGDRRGAKTLKAYGPQEVFIFLFLTLILLMQYTIARLFVSAFLSSCKA